MEQQQQRYTTPDRVRTKLRNGYKAVFNAQTADAEGRVEEARQLYYEGCSQLTRAISMRCGDTMEETRKANFMLNMAKERIRALEEVGPDSEIKEGEEEGLEGLLNDMDDIHSLLSGSQEAKEVINIPSGVSVFDVGGTVGGVSVVTKDAPAKISHIISSRHRNPVSCLQIGEMVYPLVSKASPVLQVGDRQFMFPSLDQANKYIGVLLENVPDEQIDQFQRLIMSLTNLHVKTWDDVIEDGDQQQQLPSTSTSFAPPPRPPPPRYLRPDVPAPRTVDKVSGGIQTTAEVVSAGLVWGSKKGGELLKKGANSLKTHIKPSSKGEVEISENTQQQVRTIRESTHQVSVLTGQAVGQLATGISALARLLAPHISNGVKSIVAKSGDNKVVASAKGRISEQNIKDACQVGASALSGLATLYDGLEEGAKNLGRALAEGANVTVGARYGEAAGQVTEDVAHSAVNVGLTYSQAQKLGAKALAKRAGKSTAAEVVRDNAAKPSNPAIKPN